MLFTWADDKAIQDEIITLDTLEKIQGFFDHHRNAIFFIDQVNGFAEMEGKEVKRWLDSCRAWHKAILSTSANYKSYLETASKQGTKRTLYVYRGFTPVSLNEEFLTKNYCFCERDYSSNCNLDGNEAVVEAE
jgi:hypothetical protein